jgi:hypothetical protein
LRIEGVEVLGDSRRMRLLITFGVFSEGVRRSTPVAGTGFQQAESDVGGHDAWIVVDCTRVLRVTALSTGMRPWEGDLLAARARVPVTSDGRP